MRRASRGGRPDSRTAKKRESSPPSTPPPSKRQSRAARQAARAERLAQEEEKKRATAMEVEPEEKWPCRITVWELWVAIQAAERAGEKPPVQDTVFFKLLHGGDDLLKWELSQAPDQSESGVAVESWRQELIEDLSYKSVKAYVKAVHDWLKATTDSPATIEAEIEAVLKGMVVAPSTKAKAAVKCGTCGACRWVAAVYRLFVTGRSSGDCSSCANAAARGGAMRKAVTWNRISNSMDAAHKFIFIKGVDMLTRHGITNTKRTRAEWAVALSQAKLNNEATSKLVVAEHRHQLTENVWCANGHQIHVRAQFVFMDGARSCGTCRRDEYAARSKKYTLQALLETPEIDTSAAFDEVMFACAVDRQAVYEAYESRRPEGRRVVSTLETLCTDTETGEPAPRTAMQWRGLVQVEVQRFLFYGEGTTRNSNTITISRSCGHTHVVLALSLHPKHGHIWRSRSGCRECTDEGLRQVVTLADLVKAQTDLPADYQDSVKLTATAELNERDFYALEIEDPSPFSLSSDGRTVTFDGTCVELQLLARELEVDDDDVKLSDRHTVPIHGTCTKSDCEKSVVWQNFQRMVACAGGCPACLAASDTTECAHDHARSFEQMKYLFASDRTRSHRQVFADRRHALLAAQYALVCPHSPMNDTEKEKIRAWLTNQITMLFLFLDPSRGGKSVLCVFEQLYQEQQQEKGRTEMSGDELDELKVEVTAVLRGDNKEFTPTLIRRIADAVVLEPSNEAYAPKGGVITANTIIYRPYNEGNDQSLIVVLLRSCPCVLDRWLDPEAFRKAFGQLTAVFGDSIPRHLSPLSLWAIISTIRTKHDARSPWRELLENCVHDCYSLSVKESHSAAEKIYAEFMSGIGMSSMLMLKNRFMLKALLAREKYGKCHCK